MPTYDYQCTACKNVKEVFHSIKEMEEPSEETVKEITCCETIMIRIFINAPAIKTPTKSRFGLQERKKRNHEHFKKQVFPTITDPDAKKHHFDKLGIKS